MLKLNRNSYTNRIIFPIDEELDVDTMFFMLKEFVRIFVR